METKSRNQVKWTENLQIHEDLKTFSTFSDTTSNFPGINERLWTYTFILYSKRFEEEVMTTIEDDKFLLQTIKQFLLQSIKNSLSVLDAYSIAMYISFVHRDIF